MKRIVLFLSFMCLVLSTEAQTKGNVRRTTPVRKTTVVKKTPTPEVHKIVPMTKEQVAEYTKHMVDSLQMDGTSWERILPLPGLTKAEIYRFAKEYMGKTFTNWAKNVQIDDAENGKIVCMGAMQTIVKKEEMPINGSKSFVIYNGITRQTLTLDIKDERVRVRGEGFAWSGKSRIYAAGDSQTLSSYFGESLLTMSVLAGGKNDAASGEAKFSESLRIGALEYLTGLRNYALKAKLDDDF